MSRLSRRHLLQLGALSLGASSLPAFVSAAGRGIGGVKEPQFLSGKSVIFLFQQGGPSQFETFDPKPEADDAIRTVTDTVSTSLSGVRFAEPMNQLAKLADRFSIVRSFQTNNGGHNIQPIVGPDSLQTNIGVHYARMAGATRPDSGTPTNAVLYPASVAEEVPGPQARGDLRSTGEYSPALQPFVPGAGGNLMADMKVNLPHDRLFESRRTLLQQLDRLAEEADGNLETFDALRRQAYEVLLNGGVAEALDLTNEDARVVERYDTSRYAAPGRWDSVSRGRSRFYSSQAQTIGHLLLAARRLCQAGVGFVTVHAGYAGVWDMHADGNNLNMIDGMEAVGRSTDHAIAAFVEDLEALGLQDEIMLVVTGEMGRTPRLNKNGGRDHWSKLAPLLVYGGGAGRGQVIGKSTKDGGEPATENLTPKHLISTILHTLFDVGQLRLLPSVPRSIEELVGHPTIPDLIA